MVSKNPKVPEIFVWRASDGSEIIVHYADSYGKPFHMEGLEDALYFAHTHDNHGPSTLKEIRALFEQLERDYPGRKSWPRHLMHLPSDCVPSKIDCQS